MYVRIAQNNLKMKGKGTDVQQTAETWTDLRVLHAGRNHGHPGGSLPSGDLSMKEVIAEARLSNALDLLKFLQAFDLKDVYLRNEAVKGYLIGNIQLVEETLSDGSKVRDIVIS